MNLSQDLFSSVPRLSQCNLQGDHSCWISLTLVEYCSWFCVKNLIWLGSWNNLGRERFFLEYCLHNWDTLGQRYALCATSCANSRCNCWRIWRKTFVYLSATLLLQHEAVPNQCLYMMVSLCHDACANSRIYHCAVELDTELCWWLSTVWLCGQTQPISHSTNVG